MPIKRRGDFNSQILSFRPNLIDQIWEISLEMKSDGEEVGDNEDPVRPLGQKLFNGTRQVGLAPIEETGCHERKLFVFRNHPRYDPYCFIRAFYT